MSNPEVKKGLDLWEQKLELAKNPKTKEEFIISKRKTVSFIASKKIIDFLNKDK